MPEHGCKSAEPNGSSNIPLWALRTFRQFFDSVRSESDILHLALRGLGEITAKPHMLDLLASIAEPAENAKAFFEGMVEDARTAAGDAAREVETGAPFLYWHAVVGLWSSIEVFVEDLAVAWFTNVPAAWNSSKLEKIKLPFSVYRKTPIEEHPRLAVRELSRSLSTDLKVGLGRLLPLLGELNLNPDFGPHVKRCLLELWQVRNVVVHRKGSSDAVLHFYCPWVHWSEGSKVTISHQIYAWYNRGATRFAERVLNEVGVAFGYPRCECPGANEIDERPSVGSGGKASNGKTKNP